MRLTVIRNSVDPLVQRRVEFSNDMLFPLRSNKSKEHFGLVDGILYVIHVSAYYHNQKNLVKQLTMVLNAKAKI